MRFPQSSPSPISSGSSPRRTRSSLSCLCFLSAGAWKCKIQMPVKIHDFLSITRSIFRVTHLEGVLLPLWHNLGTEARLLMARNLELCFWLFLVNSGSTQQNWFQSLYFKVWVLGSTLALTYMPLVTIFTRHDPLKVCNLVLLSPFSALIFFHQSEAFTFLAGSLGSLSLTLWFTPIL